MMKDRFSLDNHKLIFHLRELNRWVEGKEIYPIYVAISPSSVCNQRCIFCVYKYLDHKPIFLERDRTIRLLEELSKLGVKSIFWSGEGEPFLNENLVDFVLKTNQLGIDTAINTNGSLFKKEISEKILPKLTFVRFSINAGTQDSYAKIHCTQRDGFLNVIKNIKDAAKIRIKNSLNTTLGIQCLLLKENIDEIITLAEAVCDAGTDYLAVKPFLKHEQIKYNSEVDLNDESVISRLRKLEDFSTDGFKVIVRWESLRKIKQRTYQHCLSLPFMVEIDSRGDVYPCGPYLGYKEFIYGNIYKNTFQEIWKSKRCKDVMNYIYNELDVNRCMPNCRNDAINRFLWQLKNPPEHVNFI